MKNIAKENCINLCLFTLGFCTNFISCKNGLFCQRAKGGMQHTETWLCVTCFNFVFIKDWVKRSKSRLKLKRCDKVTEYCVMDPTRGDGVNMQNEETKVESRSHESQVTFVLLLCVLHLKQLSKGTPLADPGGGGGPGGPGPPLDPQIWRPQLYNLEAQCTI